MYPMKPIFLGRSGVIELFGDVPGLLLQLVQRESWANLGAGPAICPILVRSKGPMFTMRPSWAHAAPGRVGSTRKNGEMLEIRRNKHGTNQHQFCFFPPKDQKIVTTLINTPKPWAHPGQVTWTRSFSAKDASPSPDHNEHSNTTYFNMRSNTEPGFRKLLVYDLSFSWYFGLSFKAIYNIYHNYRTRQ